MDREFGRRKVGNNDNALDDEDIINNSEEEAEEDRDIYMEEDDERISEEDDGEDIMENMENEYNAIPGLDKYESDDLDEEDYSQMSMEARREAEREINERDRDNIAKQRRVPVAMLQDTEESMLSEGQELTAEIRRRRERHYQELGVEEEDMDDANEDERFLDLEEMRGKLHQWIRDPRTIRYIRRTFRKFLITHREENNSELVYETRINDMCSANKQSLEITYLHLTQANPTLAYWIFETPALILPYLNQVAFELACKYFPGYENIHHEIYIKIKDFPLEEKLRDLRTFHLNTLVKVRGVVTRRYPVYSQLKKVYYICRCGDRKGPIYQHDNQEIKLGQCANCHSNGPFLLDTEHAVYRNYQKVTVQESPGTVLPGRVPRYKDVILLGDNIDIARPGDEVEIVGIYTNKFDYNMNVKHGFPVFSTLIEANYVRRVSEMDLTELSQQDKDDIIALSKKPNMANIFINSIAPSIHGHHHIKTAISLAMFGGEAKNLQDSHKIRGDINVLLLGDPGLAKSQFLKYVEQTFPRTVYTTGKGASAVGLTASVRRDPTSKEWTLEGGALVLADQGICLIDEFDKMSENDRTSIHEAMEQQTISISKAGIVANLQARCSIIAAANPVKGRYDPQLGFSDNVNLSDPILSRFDILCVLKDEVDSAQDSDLATFIINSHVKHHPLYDKDSNMNDAFLRDVVVQKQETIDTELLKKYIIYAKKYVHPKLNQTNIDKITNFYAEIRRESQNVGGFAIMTRHIESIIRMSQASAKMHLRTDVRADDIDCAISVLLESFIQSQKVSIGRVIKKKFSSYISFKEDINSTLLHCLSKLVKEQMQYIKLITNNEVTNEVKIPLFQFTESAKELNIYDISEFLKNENFLRHFKLRGDVIVKELF